MRKIREILRLKFDGGQTNRRIARSCHISRPTVADYLLRFEEAGLEWLAAEAIWTQQLPDWIGSHVRAFAFFGGVPLSMLYDNTTIAVAKICGDGKRVRTTTFSELQSHYLFEDKFGRPGKGNDKGMVEGVVGYGRRNFLVPAPRFDSFDDLNTWLEEQCLKRQEDVVRGP